MKANNLILITSGKINKATAHIWVVSISGDNDSRVYCKSPYKAMRYAFLLKKRTGLNISDNCLCRVSHEIARNKAAAAPTTEMQPIELLLDEPSTPEAPVPSLRISLLPSARLARVPQRRWLKERITRMGGLFRNPRVLRYCTCFNLFAYDF